MQRLTSPFWFLDYEGEPIARVVWNLSEKEYDAHSFHEWDPFISAELKGQIPEGAKGDYAPLSLKYDQQTEQFVLTKEFRRFSKIK